MLAVWFGSSYLISELDFLICKIWVKILHSGFVFLGGYELKITFVRSTMVFPGDSVSKECACSVGDPGLIPGSGRSPGEGKCSILACRIP